MSGTGWRSGLQTIPSILLTNVVKALSEANKLTGEIINHAGTIISIRGAKLINRFIKFPPLLKLENVFYITPRILKVIHHVPESIRYCCRIHFGKKYINKIAINLEINFQIY